MACNCGGNKKPSAFIHLNPKTGKTTEVRTEVEARAMVIRVGGSYVEKK